MIENFRASIVAKKTARAQREALAIAFDDEVFRRTGRQPTRLEVARHVRVCDQTLSGYTQLMSIRRARVKNGAPANRRWPPGLVQQAISLQRKLFDLSGQIPTVAAIAAELRRNRRTLDQSEQFRAARMSLRGEIAWPHRIRRRSLEDKAIAFAKDFFRRHKRKPSLATIAAKVCRERSTVGRWPRLREALAQLDTERAPTGTAAGPNSQASPGNDAAHRAESQAVFSANDPRDEWLYQKFFDLNTKQENIVRQMAREHPEWKQVEGRRGAKLAAQRYAEKHGLPPIPKRRPGAPKKGTG